MSTSIFFNIPTANARVSIRPFSAPYTSSSYMTGNGPCYTTSSAIGYVEFDSVVPGIYKIDVVGGSEHFYVNIPETSGSLVNAVNLVITSSQPPTP